ncbi:MULTISPECIES: hypothetical protein [unclassified Dyella]|uniref:hypothetical protein n=1 Tax=unclassified Dyella TaxID=2634549 RepID=UPI000C857F36|nr:MULTISPECIES: hypothetical protein [unclassified Dyella]MDR3445447.1 hypothetical protein [Dyella sp.]PMQ02654.1 hypothetical protein DyAD56_23165 [Dyella sp. AD56]
MRVLVAALMGGIVMFIWGAVAHMALGLGDIGMHQPVAEDTVLASLRPGLGEQAGVFLLPSIDPAKMGDKTVMAAYSAKAKASPYAFMVYMPQGDDLSDMSGRLPREWASDTLSALMLAFVMGLAAFSFMTRLSIALAASVFAWLSTMVPYWNWYMFPTNFTVAALVEQVIGWLLAGAVMAWWLGRSNRRAL